MNFRNSHNEIQLEESSHKYILKGKEEIKFVSVTTCIAEYFEIFDKEKIAYKLVTYNPKYAGKTVEELIDTGSLGKESFGSMNNDFRLSGSLYVDSFGNYIVDEKDKKKIMKVALH